MHLAVFGATSSQAIKFVMALKTKPNLGLVAMV
jgi:hypothetical protein